MRIISKNLAALLLTTAIVVSCILLYGIIERQHVRWDLTANKDFTLSQQTKDVLKNLDRNVKIMAFFRTGEDADDIFIRRKVDDVLREYALRSSKIEYHMADPDSEIEPAVQHGITTDGTIVFESGQNKKEIYKSQLFDFNTMNEDAPPQFSGEGLFTNALLKITRERQDKICFLEGHEERKLDDTEPHGFSQVKDQLEKNNYAVSSVNLITSPKIPEDCRLLIVPGAQKPLLREEDLLVSEWVKNKGRGLLLVEPIVSPPLPETLQSLKIEAMPNLVIDPNRHFVIGPQYPSPLLTDHEITKKIQGTNPILFSVRSLSHPQGEDYQVLMTTSPEAWGETDFSKTPSFDKGRDLKGPLTLGIAIQKEGTPSAIVVGDADFASNALIQAPGNLDLFLNMVAWLVGDKEQITIRPKPPGFKNLTLTASKARFIAYFSQLGYPLLIIFASGFYWFRRKNR